jgi:hypothetical protein
LSRPLSDCAAEIPFPDKLKIGMFVFDFDKTITNKHTRGAIFQTVQAEPDELKKNFADLDFFRSVCL